jgi:cytochrome c biogenesis protein CcmG, thiol:disulfide interchange protein DsbE
MQPKHVFLALGGAGLLAMLVVGLLQLGGSSQTPSPRSTLTLGQMREQLTGSPAPLEALHAQASELLPGGTRALRARLAALRGRPVVINKWASWCEPCREELPAFQHASLRLGRQVAFIGIDSGDYSRAGALHFLRSFPVSYPSYYDHSGALGSAVTDSAFTPVTVFYDRAGAQYIRQGPYPSQAKLEQDVRRYALGTKSA